MIYLYDGSFDGFLTVIYEHYYNEKAKAIYRKNDYQIGLIEESKTIEADSVKSGKVHEAFIKKFSTETLNNIQYTFLSCDPDKDTYLLHYIVYGFKMGKKLDFEHTHESVLPVHQLGKKVSFEAHRFLGLLRFQEVGSVLYSAIEPDNDIITLVVGHFADRLKNERFIIHDKKRKQAVIYADGHWYLSDFYVKEELQISEKEKYLNELWKGYFKQIAIKERENLRLQQQFVPKKYRRNIIEFT